MPGAGSGAGAGAGTEWHSLFPVAGQGPEEEAEPKPGSRAIFQQLSKGLRGR